MLSIHKLNMPYTYKFPHPSVTTDVVLFSIQADELRLLLIKRKNAPFKGKWALPGGFLDMDEDLESCARRELLEETGIKPEYLEQLATFGAPNRDPRERVVSVAYFGVLQSKNTAVSGSSDALEAAWFPAWALPKLAFDHEEIVTRAKERLIAKFEYTNIVFRILPKEFTIPQLQRAYEIVQGKDIDKRNFRKWISANFQLEETGKSYRAGAHRPAKLYTAGRLKKRLTYF